MFKINRHQSTLNEEACDYFNVNGYVVLEAMLSHSEIKDLKDRVNFLIESELSAGNAHKYEQGQRIWNLLSKGAIFQDLIASPQLLAWMDWLFERPTPHQKYYLSSLQANVLRAGAPPQKLHIDTPVPEPLPPWIIKANSIWLLDDFTEINGSTEVIPGSHVRPRKPIPECFLEYDGISKVIAPAGSVIITHGALWHRSGANVSSLTRSVLLGSFAASFAREIAVEEDIPRSLTPACLAQLTDRVKSLIGYHHGFKPGGGADRSN